jgi:hypothetical protein
MMHHIEALSKAIESLKLLIKPMHHFEALHNLHHISAIVLVYRITISYCLKLYSYLRTILN